MHPATHLNHWSLTCFRYAECCVFYIIPGTLAKTTSPQEVSTPTGALAPSSRGAGDYLPGTFSSHHECQGQLTH